MYTRLGSRIYQVEKQWVKKEYRDQLKGVSAVATDATGNVIVLQRENPKMLFFNTEGALIKTHNLDQIHDGHYLYVTKNNHILIVDRDHHCIYEVDENGDVVNIIGKEKMASPLNLPFNNPTDVVQLSSGDLFVTDGYGNSCVHHFDQEYNLMKTWGRKGTSNSHFSTPHAIDVDSQEQLYVVDRENNRVQVFNKDGDHLKNLEDVYYPMDIHIAKDGCIYVSDQTPSLNLFNRDGVFLGRTRTFGFYGHGIAVDQEGSIYVAEMYPDNISKFTFIREETED